MWWWWCFFKSLLMSVHQLTAPFNICFYTFTFQAYLLDMKRWIFFLECSHFFKQYKLSFFKRNVCGGIVPSIFPLMSTTSQSFANYNFENGLFLTLLQYLSISCVLAVGSVTINKMAQAKSKQEFHYGKQRGLNLYIFVSLSMWCS